MLSMAYIDTIITAIEQIDYCYIACNVSKNTQQKCIVHLEVTGNPCAYIDN